MEFFLDVTVTLLAQFQKPTMAFLLGGMALAAFGSKLELPAPIYKFIVLLLLLKVGLGAGISVRSADALSLAVPALCAAVLGVAIVLFGGRIFAAWGGISKSDAMATVGLFGAVSASTLAAGMAMLDAEGIFYEGFIGALYPFMDVAALVTAIFLARMSERRAAVASLQGGAAILGKGGVRMGTGFDGAMARSIVADTLKSPAISALILGIAIGLFARPEAIYASFYEPLFRGLLSILMLVMGMEAWARLSELKKVAHAYLLYGLTAPLAHGLMGFMLGMAAHHLTGFSAGGVVLLSIMAASSSDISGPPTMRAALPEANPSAYIGASTGLGTPVAILSIPLFIALADWAIGF